ncbi:hypothetical protein T4D_17190 [Trichinella pseudospiralis]|uniref:Uncharacterized protein n=1 Tax=Trichinella pseudospiralis TaxID=6337 RepID=A0A0V1FGN9_TRIPS|nr:hypothetical protein T4D_17190 [Trichinella pseudospiralis]
MSWMVNSCRHHCGTTLKVPSIPQVRMADSSLMLEPTANTSICLDALCHNKSILIFNFKVSYENSLTKINAT